MNWIFLTLFLALAAYGDIKTGRILDKITIAGWLVAVGYAFIMRQVWWNGIVSIICFGIPFWLFFQMGLLGGGDVKLIVMLGAYVGIFDALSILLLSFLLSGIYGIILYRKSIQLLGRTKKVIFHLMECVRLGKVWTYSSDKFAFPYAPFLLLAELLYLLGGILCAR